MAGVAYGRKRIGIAICDARRIIASPLCQRHPSGDRAVEGAFYRKLVAAEGIVGFVVGLAVAAAALLTRVFWRFRQRAGGSREINPSWHD